MVYPRRQDPPQAAKHPLLTSIPAPALSERRSEAYARTDGCAHHPAGHRCSGRSTSRRRWRVSCRRGSRMLSPSCSRPLGRNPKLTTVSQFLALRWSIWAHDFDEPGLSPVPKLRIYTAPLACQLGNSLSTPNEAELDFAPQSYLPPIVCKVVSQKSTPPQIRQLILYYCQYEEWVDGGVEFCKTTLETLCVRKHQAK